MNAADYYGLDELKKACSGFIQCCVNVDTVCALLATAERYIQYKCTKTLVQKVRKQTMYVYESSCGEKQCTRGWESKKAHFILEAPTHLM